MRKGLIIIGLTALLTAVSCYHEEYVVVPDDEPVLVLNTQMSTREEGHYVSLHRGYRGKTEPVPDGLVKVFVNGVLQASVPRSVDEDGRYLFAASFAAGDEVRVTAEKDGMSVSATTVVPPDPPVYSLDTVRVRYVAWGDAMDYIQLKVGYKDLPGDSWYRMSVRVDESHRYFDEDGEPMTDLDNESSYGVTLETGSDPILSEGGVSAGENDLAAFLSPMNAFCSFSDVAFADRECLLRPMMSPWYFDDIVGLWVDEEKMTGRMVITRKITFGLHSIGFAQYHYLKALDNLETFGYDANFLVEPTTLPSNVEGGLGFVCVDNGQERVLSERSYEFPFNPNLYRER